MALQMAASSPGRAEPAAPCPVVRTPSDRELPFEADDLLRLVRLRVGDAPRCACATVEVSPGEARGVVVVTCPDRRAEVSVGERTGEAAAREVAIVLADIVLAPLPPSPPRPPAPAAPPPGLAAGPAPAAPARWSFWVAPGAAWGTSAGAVFEPHVGAARALAGPVGLLVDVGFAEVSGTAPKIAQATVDVEVVPIRVGPTLTLRSLPSWRWSAGAAMHLFRAHAADSEIGARGAGFVAADWVLRRSAPVHPYVSAGLDLYAKTLDVRVDGASALTSGYLSPWIALGVLWSRARP
jgi:hypothetical protein